MKRLAKCLGITFLGTSVLCMSISLRAEGHDADFDLDGPELAGESENASNPLAAVSNIDVRWQYLDLVSGDRVNDYFIDGAFMVNPKFKLKYELHYWETNVTGKSESDWESALLKAIYFPAQGILSGGTKYRVGVGTDFILGFDNMDKGIGMGADQIAPFTGVALALEGGTMLIPFVQHFYGVNGEDLNITAARLIALQPLPAKMWLKLDVKVPYDWENEIVPADVEIQDHQRWICAVPGRPGGSWQRQDLRLGRWHRDTLQLLGEERKRVLFTTL